MSEDLEQLLQTKIEHGASEEYLSGLRDAVEYARVSEQKFDNQWKNLVDSMKKFIIRTCKKEEVK